jgi:hemoglobin
VTGIEQVNCYALMKNTQVGVAELATSFELRTFFAARSPLERSFRSGQTDGGTFVSSNLRLLVSNRQRNLTGRLRQAHPPAGLGESQECEMNQASLYQRLGGYDTIAAFVDETYRLLRSDPKFSRFATRSMDSQQRARQLLVDQLCSLAGGPCLYIGRDMKTSHVALHITAEEWEFSVDYTRQALSKRGVGEKEANEVIALIEQYRSDIVEPAA